MDDYMKILEGQFGKCFICDCMDEKYGLPSLKDESWELCLTDPPYNLDFKGFGVAKEYKKRRKDHSHIVHYEDKKTDEEYFEWCSVWFTEVQRITQNQIISVGLSNQQMWHKSIINLYFLRTD